MTQNTTSVASAAMHAGEQRRPGHASHVFVSPCQAEQKNQDRANVIIDGDVLIAAVCDGVTQSMHGGDAAEIVCSHADSLWDPAGGLASVVEKLRACRAALSTGVDDGGTDDSFLSRAFAVMRAEARLTSYQTTLVTARVTRRKDHVIEVESITCGDSALFVFDFAGRLLHSNRDLDGVDWGFGHLSNRTSVLPDHFGSERVVVWNDVPPTAHIVLCSDGFYDVFDAPSSLFRWLLLYSANLIGGDDRDFNELHRRLDVRLGDDDMSLIWLRPRAGEPQSLGPAVPQPPSSPDVSRKQPKSFFGWFGLRR